MLLTDKEQHHTQTQTQTHTDTDTATATATATDTATDRKGADEEEDEKLSSRGHETKLKDLREYLGVLAHEPNGARSVTREKHHYAAQQHRPHVGVVPVYRVCGLKLLLYEALSYECTRP